MDSRNRLHAAAKDREAPPWDDSSQFLIMQRDLSEAAQIAFAAYNGISCCAASERSLHIMQTSVPMPPPAFHFTSEPRCRIRLSDTPPPNGNADCLLGYHKAVASLSGTAGARGGALVGRPRHARIFRIADGGWIAQSILIREPQRGQVRISNSKTRTINWAHK
jgi:hypothetical protein